MAELALKPVVVLGTVAGGHFVAGVHAFLLLAFGRFQIQRERLLVTMGRKCGPGALTSVLRRELIHFAAHPGNRCL